MRRRFVLIALAALWCGAVAIGLRELARYETTAGAVAPAPERWPTDSKLVRGSGFSVVMFLHPDCPCSRASLTELAAIADGARDRPAILIVFPSEGGEMWDRAGRIRGATRALDPTGAEAERFGAKTSGYTLVFDRQGRRRFEGGITGSRGHAGNNVGRMSVERLLTDERGPAQHAVFGCALEAS